MQVDLQKIFLSTCILPKGYPNLKWFLQKNNAGLQIKYRRGLFHNVAVMLSSCISVLLFH